MDMSDLSPLSEDSGSDQVQQSRTVRLKNNQNCKNDRNLSAQGLFNEISRAIIGAKEHQILTYEDVDPETGSWVVYSLNHTGRVEGVRPR